MNADLRADVIARAGEIKLLLMDCDGVLTDGRLYFSENGEALKVFHVRDGQGLVMWHEAGFRSGIISGRDAEKILERRVKELGMHYLKTCSSDKIKDLTEILKDAKIGFDETAYIGDDIGDVCLLEKVGLPIAVADAATEVFPFAKYTTRLKGGGSAVREVTDLLLKAKKITFEKSAHSHKKL
ncbi:MAG: KdsC family phosphatase [Pyrinomonadaceae bacterium]